MQRAEMARLAIAHAASRVRTQARADGPVVAEVGCGLLRAALPDARGRRRAMPAMRARRGVCAREPKQRGGVVRLLLSSVPLARRACVVLSSSPSRSQRAPAGVKRQPGTLPTDRLPTPPTSLPRHDDAALGPPPSHPATPRGLGPKSPQLRPNAAPSAHHHFAPPSGAARSRRPLAPSTRAARSRFPLAPPARAVRSRSRRSQPSPAPDLHGQSRPPNTVPSAHHHFAPPSRAAR